MSLPPQSTIAPGPDLAPVLVGLLRREGLGLLQQRGRLNGLLRDYAPAALRDIRLLLVAHDSGVSARLGSADNPLAPDVMAAEAGRMIEEFGCSKPLAENAVATWGRAFVGLRAPPPETPQPNEPSPVGLATPHDHDRPGWFARFGGIGLAVVLAVIALARALGWL